MSPAATSRAPARSTTENVFRAIAAKGYSGFFGLEMWPTVDHAKAVRELMREFSEATARL